MRYLNNKNYFIDVKKSSYKYPDNKKNNHNQRNDYDASKSPRTGRDRTIRSNSQRSRYNKKPNFTPEETAAYLERKNRKDQSPQRSHSPQQDKKRVFTPEETAAYLERKKRREQSPQRHHSDREKNGGSITIKPIRVYC